MKKLLLFLMVTIPLLVVLIVKLTASVIVSDVFISVDSVQFTEPKISGVVGKSFDLQYNIYPENASNKDVMFQSDNESVATVDKDGHVEFVGIGYGYISVITQDKNLQSQCYFYVYDTVVHSVSISAPQNQNYVHIGDTLQLNTEVLPAEALNKDVEYSSSNTLAATVDSNGLVSGISEGETTITATTVDGGYTATIDLSVLNPVTQLVVEQDEVVTSSQSIQVKYRIEPEDATNQSVTFAVDNDDVAEISHLGKLTFKKAGEVNVTITTYDNHLTQTVKYIYTAGYYHDIVLDYPSLTIEVGETKPLSFKVLPEDLTSSNVEISSDAEDIAYVDQSGYVHAEKGGEAVIKFKAKKNESEYIEKYIVVNVLCPANEIVLENAMTAVSTYKLNPISLPEDSTNTSYFYHSNDETKATVSEDGTITFLTEEVYTAKITVYANEDNSNVFKTVEVTFTAGKAGEVNLSENLTLNYDESVDLDYEVLPAGGKVTPKITIEKGDCIQVLEDGKIYGKGGGKARIKVEFELYNGNVVTKYCDVTVLREVENIQITVDLDSYNNQYITSEKVVSFTGIVLPVDATEKEITWSVDDKKIAFITNGTLVFNQIGLVKLTAKAGQTTNTIDIYYCGDDPVFGQVEAVMGEQKNQIPTSIKVGESFVVNASLIIPRTITPSILLQVTNQKTANPNGKVLELNGNVVKGIAGGSATLSVYIANSLRLNFEITVVQNPESVTVLQANTQTVSNVVNLFSQVLPIDTTNQNVYYVVENDDVAQIDGSTLSFKKNGIANITAYCEADKNVKVSFTIEKVEKNAIEISYNKGKAIVNKGDIIIFNKEANYTIEIVESTPIVEGEIVANVDGVYLRTLSAGNIKINVKIDGQTYPVDITVNQPVENITFVGQADYYNNEYVVGSENLKLEFNIFPTYAANKDIKFEILDSQDHEKVAYISNSTLYFTKAGVATVKVSSRDENYSNILKFRCTSGEALDAELNISSRVVMQIGQKISINVEKWIPFDTKIKRMSIYQSGSQANSVIELDPKSNAITAVKAGETKIIVELSNNLTKEIEIISVNKVTEIVAENVLTSLSRYQINATVLPQDATYQTLEYFVEENETASLEEGNILVFKKAGSVNVTIKATDGSGVGKTIVVTSTMGKVNRLELPKAQITLNKNEQYDIVATKYPLDAEEVELGYKILTEGGEQIVSLTDGKVTALSSGKVTVRIFCQDDEGVFADLEINVFSALEGIDFTFDSPLDNYQNASTYITSKKQVSLTVTFAPEDASIKGYTISLSDDTIAQVLGNSIIFNSIGRATVTITGQDKTNGTITKSFTIYFVGETLLEAELDKERIVNNVLNLKAGETYKFKLAKALPGDNEHLNFTMKDISENRNDNLKGVAVIENGVLKALNGGIITFNLYANNYLLDRLTVNVKRDATDIEIEDWPVIYTSDAYYDIIAHALESDTYQQKLGFTSLNEGVASVTQEGHVQFKGYGSCQIKVYISENPSISKTVTVEYINEIKALKFNKTKEVMFVEDYVDIYISAMPSSITNFEFEMTLDRQGIAVLEPKSGFYRLKGIKEGEVEVTAKVKGKDIKASKKFTFCTKIRNIQLELDNSGDSYGHGGYRVFANKTYINGVLTNQFNMNLTLTPADASKSLLEWSSSNEEIATVENGVVTFLKTGQVTISVQQKPPFEGASVTAGSYTFKIVEGINVFDYAQLELARPALIAANAEKQSNFDALVLHSDIKIEKAFGTMDIQYNIYGNGHMLDDTLVDIPYGKFVIARNNVILDNVVLRGTTAETGNALLKKGPTLRVASCQGVLIYNCIIENGERAIHSDCAQLEIVGCIMQNCLQSGLNIRRSDTAVSVVKVRDCIFATSNMGIVFEGDTGVNPNYNQLYLEGYTRFYNWSTLDQILSGLSMDDFFENNGIQFVKNEVYKQIKDIVDKRSEFAYSYKDASGKTEKYYHMGVITVYAKFDLGSKSVEYKSGASIDKSKLSLQYSDLRISGALNLVVVAPVEIAGLSLSSSNNPFIKPGDTYVGNQVILSQTRQPCRFSD